MGGPGEICLPLNIAFAPSTWVALSLPLLLLLLVEGNLPPSPCSLHSARPKESQVVSCPRSSKERRTVAGARDAGRNFHFNAPRTRAFYSFREPILQVQSNDAIRSGAYAL